MLRVALTGGLGSGKSTVAAIFAQMGASVSSSDEIGRALMQPGQTVFETIVRHFGPDVLAADGTLSRPALAQLAFQGERAAELNSIVHPAVIAAQARWFEGLARSHPRAVAIVESALIFETQFGETEGGKTGHSGNEGRPESLRRRFDRIVLVTAPESLRIGRYLARSLASDPQANRAAVEADARARIAMQMPDQSKAAFCDFAIENAGTLAALQAGVRTVFLRLQAEADASGENRRGVTIE